MRIAEIVNTLEIGGLERMVTDLSLGLRGMGHSVCVFCLRGAGPLAGVLEDAGVRVEALDKPEGIHPPTFLKLARMLREGRFDVVHTHNALVHHYGAVAGQVAGVHSIVNTRHGLGNFPRSIKTERIYELACTITDRVVLVCRAGQEFFELHSAISKQKFEVIYNGIPLEKFLAVKRRESTSPFVIGTVGRLVPVKNQKLLLEAFAELLSHRPDCRLEILGDGPLRGELEAHSCRLGCSGSVVFHGASLDVPRFLAGLNAFVLCSASEGLPLTVLEAMAAGLPIIGTAVGAMPELISAAACGWVCPDANPETLAGLLDLAVQGGTHREMGDRARRYARQEHALEKMVSAYGDLFERLLAKKGKAAA